jgi:hypothetical protein
MARTRVPATPGTYSLSPTHCTGVRVGRGASGEFVFVGPGQPSTKEYSGRVSHFRPWTTLEDTSTGTFLTDVAVLRITPPADEDQVFEAIATVFRGLTSIVEFNPDALGDSVLSLRVFFEGGLRATLSKRAETGLLGELITLNSSPLPSELLKLWRARNHATFDFSGAGERMDVKATLRRERIHNFQQAQVSQIPGVCSSIVSLVLSEVEVGSTVADVMRLLEVRLNKTDRAELLRKAIETTGCDPHLVGSVVIDLPAANASLLHLQSQSVPAPTAHEDVLDMSWQARIRAPIAPPPGCEIHRLLGLPSGVCSLSA